jgi:NitT/TauT family transport system ATP-binding protein
LPDASVTALAGLLEHLDQETQDVDLYKLDNELGLEMADLVRIIEMGEMLGFVVVSEGNIHLTPLGQAFSEASILTRKELFAQRARRMPMIQWMMQMLSVSANQELPWKVFYTALLPEFSETIAERQLDVAIDWGRYAELLDYDDGDELVSLDVSDGKAVGTAK